MQEHVFALLPETIAIKTVQTYGPRREETCLRGVKNNKGADQPAHPHNLISPFVIRLLESIISRLATSEITIL